MALRKKVSLRLSEMQCLLCQLILCAPCPAQHGVVTRIAKKPVELSRSWRLSVVWKWLSGDACVVSHVNTAPVPPAPIVSERSSIGFEAMLAKSRRSRKEPHPTGPCTKS
ncbi:hypothetical protein BCV69DRAFT_279839 [Microstroma glucosiphilum]|uniref:Secreted protein n=1 Tax=Pseudomicrostroma glucosiphilum TaxID=1684307 RepID=A0A316UL33_9BASI|nr:hypothetical protein BCV69DRAFT_279839 [Pseudomicrostroma glucosiphilum]PWN23935.1 hypothetical protein BCV69DRAFT_279839 [Pseudomicrostroma glucosiphilum]